MERLFAVSRSKNEQGSRNRRHVRSQRAKCNEFSRTSQDLEIGKYRQDHKTLVENYILIIKYAQVKGED